MEDVKFHQCVRLSRFENDRTISFIPPDGEFELMSYRLSTQVKPLVWAEAVIERHEGSRIEFMVKVKAQFKRRSTANNVEIIVPVPEDADSPKFRVSAPSLARYVGMAGHIKVRSHLFPPPCSSFIAAQPEFTQAGTGSVQYAPERSAMIWKIKQLGGGREFLMRAHFGLPSVKNGECGSVRHPWGASVSRSDRKADTLFCCDTLSLDPLGLLSTPVTIVAALIPFGYP